MAFDPVSAFYIATAVIAAAGTAASIQASQRSAKAQKRARELQERRDAISARREQAKQIRDARVKRASILSQGVAQGAASGTALSSAVSGGQSSVTAQAASNNSFARGQGIFNNAISAENQTAANAQSRANAFSQATNTATQIGFATAESSIFK